MKKKLLLALLTVMMAVGVSAQNTAMATLSHGGGTQVFYGYSALQVALDSASHGDVIVLSKGTFGAKNINKAVTIRGAGMGVTTSTEQTKITGDFTIQIDGGVTDLLTLEGIHHNSTVTINNSLKRATFLKCRFKVVNANVQGSTFLHCYFTERLTLSGTATVLNSYVKHPCGNNYEMRNCVVWDDNNYSERPQVSTFANCIFYSTRNDGGLYANNNTASHCVVISETTNILSQLPNTTNKHVTKLSTIFLTFRGTYAENKSFEMSSTAIKNYKGTDGTQVGMYGGALAFDPVTTAPKPSTFDVAPQTNADGTLRVVVQP